MQPALLLFRPRLHVPYDRIPMTPPTPHEFAELVSRSAQLVRRDGIHPLLAYLNSRTRYRYTGVYLFEPPVLRNLWLFDRENPTVQRGGDTPMRETYCSVVAATNAPFETADARRDERLAMHPAREGVSAYCGIPLTSPNGDCFGSLCHFDLRPRLVPTHEMQLLAAVGPIVAAVITIPPAAARASASRRVRTPRIQRPQVGLHDEPDQLER